MSDAKARKVFGRRLRMRRRCLELSQAVVAEACGCTTAVIGQMERGIKWPSVKLLRTIGRTLGCSPDFLLGTIWGE